VRLQRLDHVSLNVSDRARSIAWYRDVLGLEQRGEPRGDDPFRLFPDPDGTVIELTTYEP
jgi:catechol-2,3-dioxygenase